MREYDEVHKLIILLYTQKKLKNNYRYKGREPRCKFEEKKISTFSSFCKFKF